jgi:hypothetical protein
VRNGEQRCAAVATMKFWHSEEKATAVQGFTAVAFMFSSWSFALTVLFDGFPLLALLCFLRRALGRLLVSV